MKKVLIGLGIIILSSAYFTYTGAKSEFERVNLQYLEFRYSYTNEQAHLAFCELVKGKLAYGKNVSPASGKRYDSECLGK